MMSIILPNNLLTLELPESGIVIRAGGDQIGAVGTEGAIPYPTLMARQRRLEGEGLEFVFVSRRL